MGCLQQRPQPPHKQQGVVMLLLQGRQQGWPCHLQARQTMRLLQLLLMLPAQRAQQVYPTSQVQLNTPARPMSSMHFQPHTV
jgi:hypothetical protein